MQRLACVWRSLKAAAASYAVCASGKQEIPITVSQRHFDPRHRNMDEKPWLQVIPDSDMRDSVKGGSHSGGLLKSVVLFKATS